MIKAHQFHRFHTEARRGLSEGLQTPLNPVSGLVTFVPDFPQIFTDSQLERGDINHIFPEERAGESLHPLERKAQVLKGVCNLLRHTPFRGVSIMASRSIYELRSSDAGHAFATALPRTSLATVISICDSPSYVRPVENSQESDADGLGCARAVRAAFLLEGGLALLLYGIWHLWHLVH